jgi:hypothetical protein
MKKIPDSQYPNLNLRIYFRAFINFTIPNPIKIQAFSQGGYSSTDDVTDELLITDTEEVEPVTTETPTHPSDYIFPDISII